MHRCEVLEQTIVCLQKTYTLPWYAVLVLSGVELIFLTVVNMGLCFAFLPNTAGAGDPNALKGILQKK